MLTNGLTGLNWAKCDFALMCDMKVTRLVPPRCQLNLASQSVLEGLNACFDHRAEIYIPELGMSFQVQQEKTKIFGCQNPFTQGGGRKGLPKSFLNRFTQVCSTDMIILTFISHLLSAYSSFELFSSFLIHLCSC